MSWLGKLAGGFLGLLAGGPIGAALGAALGHQLDQSHEMGGLGFDAAGEEEYLSSFIQALFLVFWHLVFLFQNIINHREIVINVLKVNRRWVFM
jgi:DnaJ like chaperone protein